MAGALMSKIWNAFGMDTGEEAEEIEDDYIGDEETEETQEKGFFGRKKVVNMPGTEQVRMNISRPTTFEESEEICACLKERKSIIVNLEYVNKDVARRIVDFMSGAVFGLNGYIQKISNSIFLVAPYNYEITNELTRDEIKSKLSMSWLKNNQM